jgi:hypothetical protein
MIRENVVDLLRRWEELRGPGQDPELDAIALALLVEDTFDVVIPDTEIDLRILGDPQALDDLLDSLVGAT